MMYYHIFVALRKEVGEEKATETMRSGIYNRGLDIGRQFARFAPADFEGLKDAFLAIIPDGGKMFEPEILRCDAEGLAIKIRRCPLKEAWMEARLGNEMIAKMCHIAGVVDRGTFEGAGFSFSGETWRPGDEGCCRFRVRRSE
jgi:hypothetical protein